MAKSYRGAGSTPRATAPVKRSKEKLVSTNVNVIRPSKPKPAPEKPKIEYDINTDIYGRSYGRVLINGSDHFGFGIDTDSVPFCCGLREIGSFEIEGSEGHKALTYEVKVEVVRRLITGLMEDFTNTRTRGCITVIFTLVDSDECDLVEEAIKGQGLFTMVKEFTNSNSSNVNRLYVSNN